MSGLARLARGLLFVRLKVVGAGDVKWIVRRMGEAQWLEMRRERPRDRLWKKAFCLFEIDVDVTCRCAETTLTLIFVANLFSMRAFAKDNFQVEEER